jgi:hypothetical protein
MGFRLFNNFSETSKAGLTVAAQLEIGPMIYTLIPESSLGFPSSMYLDSYPPSDVLMKSRSRI